MFYQMNSSQLNNNIYSLSSILSSSFTSVNSKDNQLIPRTVPNGRTYFRSRRVPPGGLFLVAGVCACHVWANFPSSQFRVWTPRFTQLTNGAQWFSWQKPGLFVDSIQCQSTALAQHAFYFVCCALANERKCARKLWQTLEFVSCSI